MSVLQIPDSYIDSKKTALTVGNFPLGFKAGGWPTGPVILL
jgi:hypothetical protein